VVREGKPERVVEPVVGRDVVQVYEVSVSHSPKLGNQGYPPLSLSWRTRPMPPLEAKSLANNFRFSISFGRSFGPYCARHQPKVHHRRAILSRPTVCSRTGIRLRTYPSSDFSRSGTGSLGSLFWFENVFGPGASLRRDVANILVESVGVAARGLCTARGARRGTDAMGFRAYRQERRGRIDIMRGFCTSLAG
jgi:hypothetical protein